VNRKADIFTKRIDSHNDSNRELECSTVSRASWWRRCHDVLLYHWPVTVNNNNNNSHDNVYDAVIMTKVIARVHPVHLMNVDWAPGGRQPSDQASRLGLWVCRKLAAIIHHRHCYYYSPRKLILILPSHEGWKAESTCSKGAQPVLKTVYRSSCRCNHNCQWRDSNLGPLTPQSDALTTRLLRPETAGDVLCRAGVQ